MDFLPSDKISLEELNKYCAVLAQEFDFAKQLNSTQLYYYHHLVENGQRGYITQ